MITKLILIFQEATHGILMRFICAFYFIRTILLLLEIKTIIIWDIFTHRIFFAKGHQSLRSQSLVYLKHLRRMSSLDKKIKASSISYPFDVEMVKRGCVIQSFNNLKNYHVPLAMSPYLSSKSVVNSTLNKLKARTTFFLLRFSTCAIFFLNVTLLVNLSLFL